MSAPLPVLSRVFTRPHARLRDIRYFALPFEPTETSDGFLLSSGSSTSPPAAAAAVAAGWPRIASPSTLARRRAWGAGAAAGAGRSVFGAGSCATGGVPGSSRRCGLYVCAPLPIAGRAGVGSCGGADDLSDEDNEEEEEEARISSRP